MKYETAMYVAEHCVPGPGEIREAKDGLSKNYHWKMVGIVEKRIEGAHGDYHVYFEGELKGSSE